ncbi:hypothetical protein HDK64DRAFT_282182 [Phyllosticta capitalensis]
MAVEVMFAARRRVARMGLLTVCPVRVVVASVRLSIRHVEPPTALFIWARMVNRISLPGVPPAPGECVSECSRGRHGTLTGSFPLVRSRCSGSFQEYDDRACGETACHRRRTGAWAF